MAKVARVIQIVGLLMAVCGGLYLFADSARPFNPAVESPTARALSAGFFGKFPIIIGLALLFVGILMRWIDGARNLQNRSMKKT